MHLSGKIVPSQASTRSSQSEIGYDIILRWSALPWSVSNGQVTGYTVYFRESILEDSDYLNLSSPLNQYLFKDVQVDDK